MRFMLIVKGSKDSEAGVMPSAELLSEMGNFNEELDKAGVLLAGEGLHPSSKGARVRFSGPKRTVVNGPFPNPGDLIAGFWVIEVKSLDDAIAWVKKVPNPAGEESEIEIRQVFSEADFGDLVDEVPEVFEAERRMRENEEARMAERKRGATNS